MTITTCDDELCQKLEPNVAVSSKRFSVLKQMAENGIFAGILLMPVLPFIEDNEENISSIIIRLAHENRAQFIYPAFGVTLRQNQRDWYYRKLDQIFPKLKEKYIRSYGNSYECRSPRSNKLWELVKSECESLGLLYKMEDIVKGYKKGYDNNQQLTLF